MKATIERAKLLRCLSHVQSVVERRNTIPILSNVLIEASADGRVRIMATDLDLQVVESLDAASVETRGRDHRLRRTCCSTSPASCPTAARSASRPPTTA